METYSFILLFLFLFSSCVAEDLKCPKEMKCALRLSCTGHEGSIILVYNPHAKTAIVIDTETNISMVSSGDLGVDFFYEDGKYYGISVEQKQKFESTQSYTSYVKNIQKIHLGRAKGKKFPIRKPPDSVLDMHTTILRSLQNELEDCDGIDKETAFNILIILIKQLSDLKKNILRGIIMGKLYSKEVLVEAGLMNVVSVFRGIARFIQFTEGEFERVALNCSNFDLGALFIRESATGILIEIMKQIDQPQSKIYDIFDDIDKVIVIIQEFNGGLYSGMRSVESVALYTILYMRKRISLEAFIDHLIMVTTFSKPIDLESVFKKINNTVSLLQNNRPLARFFHIKFNFMLSVAAEFSIQIDDLSGIIKTFLPGLMESRIVLISEILRRTTTDYADYVDSLGILNKRLVLSQSREKTLAKSCGVLPKKSLKNVTGAQFHMGIPSKIITKRRTNKRLKSINAEGIRGIFNESNLSNYKNQGLDELNYYKNILS